MKDRRYNAYAPSIVKPGKRYRGQPTKVMQDFKVLGKRRGRSKYKTMFEKVDNMSTQEELTQYIGGHKWIREKHLAWNFAHFRNSDMIKDPTNTIEFRR